MAKPVELRLSDDYVRQNRERLQREYDFRQRALLLQKEISRRWAPDADRRRNSSDARAVVEEVGVDFAIFRLESSRGVRLMRTDYEIIAGHVLLEAPYEVTRTVTYSRVDASEPQDEPGQSAGAAVS